jgi:LysM repeat protein
MMGETIHAIIISSTNDATIGKGSNINHTKIVKELKTIGKNIDYKVKLYPLTGLTGSEITVKNINTTINRVNCSSNDIIIFWYSGHGLNDPNSDYPVFLINHQKTKLRLDRVHSRLLDKGSRFVLTVGDCCNLGGRLPRNTKCSSQYDYIDDVDVALVKKNYIKLFKNLKGGVIARSSQKGEYSHYSGDIGGLFTYSLLDAFSYVTKLETAEDEIAIWNDVVKYSNCMTVKMANLISKQQNPIIELNINQKENASTQLTDIYTVQKGDKSLYNISLKYKITDTERQKWIEAVCEKHNITTGEFRVGMELNLNKSFLYEKKEEIIQTAVLKIPKNIDDYIIKYVVNKNETLSEIANKLNIPEEQKELWILWFTNKYQISPTELKADAEYEFPNMNVVTLYKVENNNVFDDLTEKYDVPQSEYATWVTKQKEINKLTDYNLSKNTVLIIAN